MELNTLESIKTTRETDMVKCIADKDGLTKDNGKMERKKEMENFGSLEKYGEEYSKTEKESNRFDIALLI